MVSIKRITAALLVLLFAATIIPQTQVSAASAATNEKLVYNYLVGKLGFNTAAACGLMANIKHESGFNISETGDGNTSYGLFQWHAGRKSRLINYCKSNGLNYKSVEGQLTYFQYELKSSYKKVYTYLKSVDNSASGAYKAGYYFCYYYEIPANRKVKAGNRGALARDTFWKKYSKSNGKQIAVGGNTSSDSSATSTTSAKASYTRKIEVKSNCMYGADIKYMQRCLKKLGYKIDADGYYGNGSASVVKQFQKANGISADGKINEKTWKAIVKAVENGSGSTSDNKTTTTSKTTTTAAAKLSITQQPASVAVNNGKSASFTVKASGKGLSYQWYIRKANDSDWSKWSGKTAATAKVTATDALDGAVVKCVVKDSSGKTVTSKAAKLSVSIALSITQQPKSVKISCSDTAKFTVKAEGKGLKYQWYYKKSGSSKWVKWAGHNTATTSAISNTSWKGMQVRCVVTDANGSSVTSSAAGITLVGNQVAVG